MSLVYRFRQLALGLAAVGMLHGHATWVAPAEEAQEPGKTVTVRIGHGHGFPVSEEAINISQVELFAVTPAGVLVKLTAQAAGKAVDAPYALKEKGRHRFAFIQDRGVNSRTPDGMKPGGRDRNPNATSAAKTMRTAVAGTGKALGLPVELTAKQAGSQWQLQFLRNGKPAGGAEVSVYLSGVKEPVMIGKAGADGRVAYTVPAGVKGPLLFVASQKNPAPQGSVFDTVNFDTSLFVSW
jgi:uncharacterized GH25 family protein